MVYCAENHWLYVEKNSVEEAFSSSRSNKKIFIQENAFQNVICKMSAILFRSRFVNPLMPGFKRQRDYMVFIYILLKA